MDEQTANLIRETLQGLSQTTAPMWAAAVKAHQLQIIGNLIGLSLGVFCGTFLVHWALKKRAELPTYDDTPYIFAAVIVGILTIIVGIMLLATLSDVLPVLFSPEGHLIRQILLYRS